MTTKIPAVFAEDGTVTCVECGTVRKTPGMPISLIFDDLDDGANLGSTRFEYVGEIDMDCAGCHKHISTVALPIEKVFITEDE